MRVFSVSGAQVQASLDLPEHLPEQGYIWIACTREAFLEQLGAVQNILEKLTGQTLVDLHVSDLLNAQLPSRFDYSSHYDLMVFRRLAQGHSNAETNKGVGLPNVKRPGPPVLHRIDTSPVGFAVFDRVLVSVHPADCSVREAYASRLLASTKAHDANDPRSTGARPAHVACPTTRPT
jgi:magnesium transporter